MAQAPAARNLRAVRHGFGSNRSGYFLVVKGVSTNEMLPASSTVPIASSYSVPGIRNPSGTANDVVPRGRTASTLVPSSSCSISTTLRDARDGAPGNFGICRRNVVRPRVRRCELSDRGQMMAQSRFPSQRHT